MAEIELKVASRYIRRQFEKAIGKSIIKLLTELITNSDDSYSRLGEQLASGSPPDAGIGRIEIVFDRLKRRFAVVDQAEGMAQDEMAEKLAEYGAETALSGRARVRGLFGKGVRDVLFTQKVGHIKSIKEGRSSVCKFRWKNKAGHEVPVVDIQQGPRVTAELRQSWGIQDSGSVAEFRLRDDVRLPQTDKLGERLSGFYMLRLVNSNPQRCVELCVVRGPKKFERHRIAYRFPEGEKLRDVRISWKYEHFPPIQISGEICRHPESMTQGEVGYEEREGGILLEDENHAVLDLTLFGFDEHPYARRLFGRIKLDGAGGIIRSKLNQARPEEILTETRDGFNRKHAFYKELSGRLEAVLKPIVEEETRYLKQAETEYSEETARRHRKAFDRLNELYKQMVGDAALGDTLRRPALQKPESGIEFLRKMITVTKGRMTPAALLLDVDVIPLGSEVELSSDTEQILIDPLRFTVDPGLVKEGVGLKILRLKGLAAGASGEVHARSLGRQATMSVRVVDVEVFVPLNGLAFNPDHIRIHDGQRRGLNLYIDGVKIAWGERIEILSSDSDVVVVGKREIVFNDNVKRTGEVGMAEVPVVGYGIGKRAEVIVVGGDYRASAQVEVTSKVTREEGLGGRFRGFRFARLDRKVQTMLDTDGYILINSNDPVNKKYFGENPTQSVEQFPHCQIRVADLLLDECLQMMVSEALQAGTLERRFPDNPEIDMRNYVSEKKFEYGPEIHAFLVRTAALRGILGQLES